MNEQQIAQIVAQVTTAVLATLSESAPAKTEPKAPAKPKAKAQPKADNEFVTWLRDTAPARAERKVTNKALAAKLDETRKGWRGAANREAIWGAAKAGKRVPAVKAA